MRKRFLILLLLVAVAFLSVGCPFLVSSAHTRAHTKAMSRHMTEIHQFFDRHFWLYDWEDPYVN